MNPRDCIGQLIFIGEYMNYTHDHFIQICYGFTKNKKIKLINI